MLLVLTYFKLRMGHFTASSLPVLGTGLDMDKILLFKNGKEVKAADGGVPVAHHDEKERDDRLKRENTMHMVALLLSSPARHRRCCIVAKVSEPAQIFAGRLGNNRTGDDGVRDHYISMAKGSYAQLLQDIFGTRSSMSLLTQLGLDLSFDLVAPSALGMAPHPGLEAILADEEDIVHELWSFVFHLLRFNAQSNSHYDQSVPGVLALNLSANEDVRKLGMEWCKSIGAMLEEAEKFFTHMQAYNVLKAVPTLDCIICRETALAARQWHFLVAPSTSDRFNRYSLLGPHVLGERAFFQCREGSSAG